MPALKNNDCCCLSRWLLRIVSACTGLTAQHVFILAKLSRPPSHTQVMTSVPRRCAPSVISETVKVLSYFGDKLSWRVYNVRTSVHTGHWPYISAPPMHMRRVRYGAECRQSHTKLDGITPWIKNRARTYLCMNSKNERKTNDRMWKHCAGRYCVYKCLPNM